MHKHIINGISAALTLRYHIRENLGNIAVFEDSLIVGPLYLHSDDERFISERKKFWEQTNFQDDSHDFISYSLSEFLGHIKEAESFTLWLSPGAHDQFMWAWLTHVFELYNKDWSKVTVRHLFNKPDSIFPYVLLGELNSKEFEKCKEFEVKEEHLSLLKETYTALCHNTPELLVELSNRNGFPLPELQASVKAYLGTYPDLKTGLRVMDKALLSGCTKTQMKSARIVANALMFEEYADRLAIGDIYLFDRLVNLTQLHAKNPLLHLHGTVKDAGSMRFTEVEITDLGQAVLEGKENNIELNGIDEHIGGVHLSSEKGTAVWFYDDGKIVKKE